MQTCALRSFELVLCTRCAVAGEPCVVVKAAYTHLEQHPFQFTRILGTPQTSPQASQHDQ